HGRREKLHLRKVSVPLGDQLGLSHPFQLVGITGTWESRHTERPGSVEYARASGEKHTRLLQRLREDIRDLLAGQLGSVGSVERHRGAHPFMSVFQAERWAPGLLSVGPTSGPLPQRYITRRCA